jgi:hypothetical protein
VREIRRTTSARHRGQRKIEISKLAGISIREVAWELEEDMDLDLRPPGAAGDLKASGQGRHRPLGRPRSVGHTVDRSVGSSALLEKGTPHRHRPLGRPRPAPGNQQGSIPFYASGWFLLTAASSGGTFRRFYPQCKRFVVQLLLGLTSHAHQRSGLQATAGPTWQAWVNHHWPDGDGMHHGTSACVNTRGKTEHHSPQRVKLSIRWPLVANE